MNKLLVYGGLGAVALVGFVLVRGHSTPAASTQDSSNASMPLSYATGFGANSISAGGISGGATADNSAAQMLADAVNKKSTNDLALGLAQSDVTKSLGLASIASNLQTSLEQLGNSRLHDVFASVPILTKNGVSGVFGNVNSNGLVSSNILYTDNSKNASLVTGYNSRGDKITLDNTIQSQYVAPGITTSKTPQNTGLSGQTQTSVYDPVKGWGVSQSGKVTYQ